MNIDEKNFLLILSSSINNNPVKLSDPVNFDNILEVASNQKIMPLIYENLCEHKDFLQSESYKKNSRGVLLSVVGQAKKTDEFLKIYKKLSDSGFYPVVVKGIICRKLYGKFEDHRPSSDEDIIVKKSEFFPICKILEDNGFSPTHKVSGKELETLQALSFYSDDGVQIEVHHNPIGCENDIKSSLDKYFHDIFNDTKEVEINGIKVTTMNSTNHFLFLIFHAFKHFIGSGFGVRQVLDILFFEKNYEDEIDWNYINNSLSETNVKGFFCDIIDIGNRYMGFDLPVHGEPCCSDLLLEDLLSNGVFGNDTQAKLMAGTLTSVVVENRGNNSEIKTLFRTIFPSREYMETRNPEIIERPWLFPVKVVSRWGTFLKKRKTNGKDITTESLSIGSRRIELLKKYKIVK